MLKTLLLGRRAAQPTTNQVWRLVLLLAMLLGPLGAWAQNLINETFEGTNSFTVANGTQANKWFVGTVGTNGPTTTGTKAAYVDNGTGATNAYTIGTAAVVHMYQDVVIPAGQTVNTLSFDWKGQGEGTLGSTNYDYMRVFAVPTTTTPVAGTELASGQIGLTNYNLTVGGTAYARASISLPASVAGTTLRIVFSWRNDGSSGTQPPIAIDNVLFTSAMPVPICGTTPKTVGPSAGTDFPTLTAALNYVNANGICGSLVLELQSNYVSSSETFPLVYSNTAGTSTTSTVTIRPATGANGLSITSANTTATFNINGGKYLIIDGRPGGSGSTVSGAVNTTNDLTIANTSTSGIPLNLASDAQSNTLQHCQVKGVGSSSSYPDINFSSTATAGNSNNTIQYNNIGGTSSSTTPAVLVYSGNNANATNTISNNNLFDFYGSSTATAAAVYLSSAGAGWTISNNSLYQTASRTGGASTTHYGVYIPIGTTGGGGHTISGNYIGGSAAGATGTWTVTGTAASYRFVGVYLSATTSASTVSNNTIANMSWYSSSTSGTAPGVWAGMYLLSNATVQGNVVGNGVTVTTTATGSISYGIVSSAGPTTLNVSGNTIVGLTMAGSSTSIANSVAGIQTAATTTNIYQNKIYGLTAANAGVTTGILLFAGTTATVYNNLIGNLTAPASTTLLGVAGLSITAGTTVNAYYNTIYLNATSSGATFGTSGVYLNSTSSTLTFTDNIIVNTSTAVGTGGYTAAFRRVSGTAGTAPANYATASNNNLFYVGTPSATNLLYVEGTTAATNAQQTLTTYKAFMATRDQASKSENPPFLSTIGTDPTFLHINTAVATQVESGGTPVSGITTDFDSDIRNTSTPDIGADEGTFTPNDQTPPSITYTALGNTASTANRTLTATITDASGVATGAGAPVVYYRKGTSGTYFNALATTIAGSNYTFTIDYANVGGTPAAGDIIQYYIAAQDASANNNAGTSPGGGSGINPPGSTAPGSPNSYTILPTLSGDYYVMGTAASNSSPGGTTREFATLTAAAAAYNNSGLGGAVRFLLFSNTQGTETYPITFNANGDASATNTLIIKPYTGVATTFTNTTTTSTLKTLSGSYIIIDGSNTAGGTTRDLTLSNTSTTATAAALVWVASTIAAPSAGVQVRNLTLQGAANTGTSAGVMVSNTTYNTSTGGSANGVVIANNTMQGTSFGVVVGNDATTPGTGLQITNNVAGPAVASATMSLNVYGLYVNQAAAPLITGNMVRNQGTSSTSYGIYVGTTSSPSITGNTVTGLTTSSGMLYGIYCAGTSGTVSSNNVSGLTANTYAYGIYLAAGSAGTSAAPTVVNGNKIYTLTATSTGGYGGIGIDVLPSVANAYVRISNNFVADLHGTGYTGLTSGGIVGILLNGSTAQSGISVYYNSVSLSGTYAGTGTTSGLVTAALGVTSGNSGLDVRNNAFSNSLISSGGTGTSYALYSAAAASAYTASNYNDYYVSGTGNKLAYFSTADVATLAALQSATTGTGQDANSLNIDPAFNSATDLHTAAGGLNAAATTISGVTTDIDGDARNGSTPDIGADEFTPASLDLKPNALTAPTVAGCYGSAEAVTVLIQNNGTSPIDFSVNNATVTVSVTGAATQVFTTTINSGTLANGTTQSVTLPGTLNMTAAGTYNFAITATVSGDANTANDNITATRTTAAPQTGLPYLEQFNSSTLPTNFTTTNFIIDASANNGITGSNGISVELDGGTYGYAAASATTPTMGPTISAVNQLTFDARFINYSGTAKTFGTSDKLVVQVAVCGGTFATIYTIDQTNYNGTGTASTAFYTYNVPLSGVGTGQRLQVRLAATYGSGDYYVDVDNINIRSLAGTDLSPTALLAPTSTQGCYGPAETVTVTVKNLGTATLDFATNPATVTVNVTGATTATLTGGISTGTLAAGLTQDVTLTPTLNMSGAGTYTFAINATVTGDQNTANDNLTATRTVAAPVAGTIAPASSTLCNSGTATLTLTGSANGSIQYQTSPDNMTFTNVASGGTTATYTTPVITSTTYYRAQTTCGTNVVTSNVATLTVNTPLVTSTNSPQAVCSGSTATVTANGSSGTTVRFFAAATGGTALATGTAGTATASYTTPALTANATYYAEAFTGGTEAVGKTTTAVSDGGYQGTAGLVFTTTGPNTIKSVTVYNATATAGSMAVALTNNSTGAVISTSATFAIPAGSTTALIPTVLNINLNVPAAGTYRLMTASSPTPPTLYRGSAGTVYPYNSPSGTVSITSGYFLGTSTSYYFFYNWQLSSECVSAAARTPVQVNVNPQPTATATNNGPVCAGSPATVSVALTGTAPWNLTYSDGTTPVTVTGVTATPYTFTTGALSATTTYSVTALSDANCTATASPVASTTVTVRPLPTFSTTQTNVSCFGSNSGSITVTAAGGTGPYSYSLDNGTNYTASATTPYTFTGLAPGTYQVLVRGQFCTALAAQPVTITQPASASSVTATTTNTSSSSAADGTLTATGNGGTSPYQYSIDGTNFLPTTATAGAYTFTGLMAASYTVTVRDANACTATTTATVGSPGVCTTTTYTGAATGDGTNWFNAANWTACVPTRTVDATIPAGLGFYPNLTTTATAEVRNLTIASGASLAQSAGTLAVYGNLSNAGTADLTGGTVALLGSSPTVTGLSMFYRLDVNLSNGMAALGSATSISNRLTMTVGVLNTNSYTLTLLTGSTLVEDDNSYLLGTVSVPDRTLTAGTSESFSGIGLVLTPAVGSTNPGATPVVRTTGTALTGVGTSVSIKRYFDIQPAVNTGLNVTMDLSYLNHELNGIPSGNLALFKSVSGNSGPWANQSPISAAGNTITKTGIADFSIWTLGNSANPLPVELTAFTADRQGLNASLTWTTASEKNNAGFEVQVSTNGRDFRKLGFVASASPTSTTTHHYAFLDAEKGKTGLRYYRLRQLDLSGAAEFSPVRTVRFDAEGFAGLSFSASPNPFQGELKLMVTLPAGTTAAAAQLRLTDAAGRLLLALPTPVLAVGESPLAPLDLHELASGVYFVQLAFPGQPVQHLKVVKE